MGSNTFDQFSLAIRNAIENASRTILIIQGKAFMIMASGKPITCNYTEPEMVIETDKGGQLSFDITEFDFLFDEDEDLYTLKKKDSEMTIQVEFL